MNPTLSFDPQLLRRLAAIDWFAIVGNEDDRFNQLPLEDGLGELAPHWKSVIEGARVQLSQWVKTGGHGTQQFVALQRQALAESGAIAERAAAAARARGLPEIASEQARWVMVNALVESAYRAAEPPTFFREVVTAYEAGFLPCAWTGDVAESGLAGGELVVC